MEQPAYLRELIGFSQRALAKESGVSAATNCDGPWLEYINRYAERCEKRIEASDFDLGNVNEFVATVGAWRAVAIFLAYSVFAVLLYWGVL